MQPTGHCSDKVVLVAVSSDAGFAIDEKQQEEKGVNEAGDD